MPYAQWLLDDLPPSRPNPSTSSRSHHLGAIRDSVPNAREIGNNVFPAGATGAYGFAAEGTGQ